MDAFKKLFNERKSEIATGIIVFFITAIISKTVHLLSDVAPVVGFSIVKFFLNIIYKSASEQNESSLISLLIWIGFTSVFVIILMQAIRSLRKANESLDEMNDTLNLIEKEKKGESVNIPKQEKPPIEREINGFIKTTKRLKLMSILLIAMTLIWAFYIVVASLIPNYIWNNFRRDITMITPYTDQEIVERMESYWVRMKGLDDYNDIYNVINSIKNENNLS